MLDFTVVTANLGHRIQQQVVLLFFRNQNLDSSIAIHQDAQKGEHATSDRNNEEQNTSTLMFDTHEHLTDGNTSKEEDPLPEDEHSTVDETPDHLGRSEADAPPESLSEAAHVTESKDEKSHTPAHKEDESKCDREQEEKEGSDRANEENSDGDPNASKDNDSEEGANEEISDDDRNPDKDNFDEQEANEESSSGDHNQSNDEKEGIAEESPPTPESHHEEVDERVGTTRGMVSKDHSSDTGCLLRCVFCLDQDKNVVATEADEDGRITDDVMEVVEEPSSEAAVENAAQEEDSTVENPDVEMSEQLEDNVNESVQPASESEGAIIEERRESEKINDESSSEKATPNEDTSKEASKQAEEDEEKETATPKRRSSSRRSAAVVATEPRVSTRAKATPATVRYQERRQESVMRKRKKRTTKRSLFPPPKSKKSNVDAKKKVENVEESKTPRQRGRRVNLDESKGTPAATPSKGRRSARKDAAEAEDENVDEKEHKESKQDDGDDSSPKRSSPRRRSSTAQVKVEVTPKASATRRGRSKNESTSSATDKEGKKESNADVETPRKLRKSATTATPQTPKKSAKTPKSAKKEDSESHDPYDIDTEMEKHPEPLKNIQMEVQSFGEVKYAKVGSGKYERTEKTAELRVGNLAELTPRTKQRRSLADLTPGRKKAASAAGSSTAPQPSRGSRKSAKKDAEVDDEDNQDEQMEVDDSANEKSTPKRKANTTTPKPASSSRKRRAPSETPVVPSKRQQIEVPHLEPAELLAVDYPQDEHAQYEAGARVYAMFDGLFYPAIVVRYSSSCYTLKRFYITVFCLSQCFSRDGLGRYKVHFIEDDLVKDVPPAGVIPLRALDRDKECFYSESVEKDRLAVKVVKSPDHTSASAWFEAEFVLEQLDDDGEPTGKKLKGTWTKLALSKDDWREYINRKSREATDVIADNIESTEDRQLRRSKAATPHQKATPRPPPKSSAKKSDSPSSQPKTPARGGRQKKASAAKPAKAEAEEEEPEDVAETHTEQIFAGMLFILTSANRPNNDTGFKKKFMTDFISSHGGLVVDDMKASFDFSTFRREVDEHPEMERFLISDTHYRTHKYLAALVRAMPCVSHEWISKCLDEKKLVDYKPFLLPSGVSILDEQEYPLPTKRGLLLRNKRVMVHSNVTPPSKKSMSFEQIWVPMVPQLGGEIVTDMPNEEGKLDILLTDHSATPSLVEKARKIGCLVVSSEWLIQVW
ncbi:BRCA1 protein [Ostertagia ostertagi]